MLWYLYIVRPGRENFCCWWNNINMKLPTAQLKTKQKTFTSQILPTTLGIAMWCDAMRCLSLFYHHYYYNYNYDYFITTSNSCYGILFGTLLFIYTTYRPTKCETHKRKLAHLMRMECETLLPQRILQGISAIPKIIPTEAVWAIRPLHIQRVLLKVYPVHPVQVSIHTIALSLALLVAATATIVSSSRNLYADTRSFMFNVHFGFTYQAYHQFSILPKKHNRNRWMWTSFWIVDGAEGLDGWLHRLQILTDTDSDFCYFSASSRYWVFYCCRSCCCLYEMTMTVPMTGLRTYVVLLCLWDVAVLFRLFKAEVYPTDADVVFR